MSLLALILLFKFNAKHRNFTNHTESSKRTAALTAKNITPLTKILRCTESNVASKVTKFISCHCAIKNCDHLIGMLKKVLCPLYVDQKRDIGSNKEFAA